MKSLPEGGCYWLRLCYVAMTMVMLVCAKFHDHTYTVLYAHRIVI